MDMQRLRAYFTLKEDNNAISHLRVGTFFFIHSTPQQDISLPSKA